MKFCSIGAKKKFLKDNPKEFQNIDENIMLELVAEDTRLYEFLPEDTKRKMQNDLSNKNASKAMSALLRKDIQKYIRDLCKWKGVEIIAGHMMPDHIHILVEIPPRISISSFMGYLKGKSAMMIFNHHANLKYKFGNKNFWAEGYYVSTVGLNEATIRKYIREQENEDMIKDKLTKKEYENPFKGTLV